jgi:hypothetical protein
VSEHDQYTAFLDGRKIASGDLRTVTIAAEAGTRDAGSSIVILSDSSGRVVDIDPRILMAEVGAKALDDAGPRSGRGRPKLGVVAREITLLPRHWEWLNGQPGGASAALRRLVDQARRGSLDTGNKREIQEVVHRAMTTLGGDLGGYEEALRALYAGDRSGFLQRISSWPPDVRDYIRQMASAGWTDSAPD